ncbi:MAG TPA: DUF255 domain-containing protein [Thiobacillus sp.]|nr:DUF255 domain-containing protein [Thiobacillus sp.]
MSGFERNTAFATLLLSLLLPVAVAAAPVNQLVNHPSPYLALHGSDPVAWQEWNAATIARAKRKNKLLFVSVGYFACHWCHVMQRESYKNAQIAALLNRDFIPVKVDRELNSGLDDALQTFSAQLNGVAGWPLNAFVTPEGFPAFVVLYAPPDDFRKLLSHLAERWAADPAGIRRLARQAAPPPAQPPDRAPLTAARTARAADVLDEPRYREIARGTLGFMQDELLDPGGGLYSSTSAVDAAGREGAAYLWEPDELKRRLPPEAFAAARRVWRLDAPRSFDHGYLPAEYRTPTADERRLLATAVRILRPVRQARSLPKDDKLNASLNGLALSAFTVEPFNSIRPTVCTPTACSNSC